MANGPDDPSPLDSFLSDVGLKRTPLGSIYDPERGEVVEMAPALQRERGFLDNAADFGSQAARGLAESGTSLVRGVGNLVGSEGITGFGEELQRNVQGFYGEPEGGAGTAGRVAGRVGGELAQFVLPGRALGYAGRALSKADDLGRVGSAITRIANPSSRAGRFGREALTGSPPQAAIAAAGPEESMLGLAADVTGSETLSRAAESPYARAGGEVVADVATLGLLEGAGAAVRGLRGARRADDAVEAAGRTETPGPSPDDPDILREVERSTEGLTGPQRRRMGRVGARPLERELEEGVEAVEGVREASAGVRRTSRRLEGADAPRATSGDQLPTSRELAGERARLGQGEPLPDSRAAAMNRVSDLLGGESGSVTREAAQQLGAAGAGAGAGHILAGEEGAVAGGLVGLGATRAGRETLGRGYRTLREQGEGGFARLGRGDGDERVVAATIKDPETGKVYRAPTHAQAIEKAADDGASWSRVWRGWDEGDPEVVGFATTKRDHVSRDEAIRVAGLENKRIGGRSDELLGDESGRVTREAAQQLGAAGAGGGVGYLVGDKEGAAAGALAGMGVTPTGRRLIRRGADEVGGRLRGGADVEVEKVADVADGEGGLFQVAAEKVGKLAERVRGAGRRQFTVVGDLPEDVAERELKMNNRIQTELKQTRFVQRDFDRALEEAGYSGGFSGLDEDQLRRMDGALKGEVSLDEFAAPVATQLRRMRDHIDRLSRRMVEEGVVEGPLAATVNANLGTYARRSYRIFDDPEWAENVPPKVRNRAKAWFRQEIKARYPNLSDEAVEQRARGEINKILYNKADSPLSFFASGKLGSKDLGILKRRKDVPEPIRRLMGEYEDPAVNYVRSVHDMSDLLEKQAFLDDVRRTGMDEGWLSEEAVGDVAHPIAADQSSVMSPLNGLHTTREIQRAFAEYGQMLEEVSGVTRWLLMKPIGLTKMGKTVLSPMTHVRNFESNVLPQIAAGHNPFRHWSKGARAVRSQIPAVERLTTRLGADADAAREYLLELKELGVVDQSARAGEMRDVLRDAFGRADDPAGELTRGRIRGAAETATDAYMAEDDFWKAVFYESERAMYREALPDMGERELKDLAARRTREMMPTYDRVSNAVKRLRRFPFMSSFPSFYAEVIRNSSNLLRRTARELASDNPALRKIGRRRAMGILATATVAPVVSAGSRFLVGAGAYGAGKTALESLKGGDDEEDGLKGAISADMDRDIRRFLPPWSQNSTIVYTGREEDGKLGWVDLSYTDYYAGLRKPVTAMMRGEEWTEKAGGAIKEALDPFASEDIFVQKILDVARNKTSTGGEVWNPQDPATGKVEDVLAHFWDALEPGGITSGRRIASGLRGEVRPWGQSYDPKREAAAVAAGIRFQQLDVPQALSFRVRDHREATRDAQRILTRAASNRGEVGEGELRDAYREMESSRQKVWREAYEDAQAAMRLGMDERQVYQMLDQSFSQRDARAILQGVYLPYRPSDRFFRSMVENVRASGDREATMDVSEKASSRRRIIMEEAAGRGPMVLDSETGEFVPLATRQASEEDEPSALDAFRQEIERATAEAQQP